MPSKKTDWVKWGTIFAAASVVISVLLYFWPKILPELEVSVNFPDSMETNKIITFVPIVQGGSPPYKYTWDFGDNSPTSNLEKPTHSYPSSDRYAVSVLVTDSIGSSKRSSAVIEITDPTPADWKISIIAPDSMQTDEDKTFGVNIEGGVGGRYKYTWDFGDNSPTSNLEKPTHSYSSEGNYALSVNVTDSKGAWKVTSKIITVTKEPPNLKVTPPLAAGQLGEIQCAARQPFVPGSNQAINCGFVVISVRNEGNGAATNCVLDVTITPNFPVPVLPGQSPSQEVRSSPEVKIPAFSSLELSVNFDYERGAGEYNVSGKVICSEQMTDELTRTVQATH